MKVHWVDKWMCVPYDFGSVMIKCILSKLEPGTILQVCPISEEDLQLDSDVGSSKVEEFLPYVKELLATYAEVFADKVSFRPPRPFSHTIPLVPGARPVNIRPYRYAPALKTEIERWVQKILNACLIQPSDSPFFSPVLLVKTKENTFKFCVDYRHLNAITSKGQFPVSIIEEFLDELKNASWFSTLDLCSSFHQIPMHPDDCFKTVFQTHSGHYEFRVMSFGLTGTPHSF
jgi:hypothetical protein